MKKQSSSFFNLIKPIFTINKRPTPWSKAIKAAICAGVPVIVGLLLGNLSLGMLGSVGSFTYLYVFNEPYAFRFKKILCVAISIGALVGLGSLVAPYPPLIIIIVGLIGFTGTFIFGVQKIAGPAAIFLVLSFVMSTAHIIPVEEIPVRAFVVFLSGCFSLFVSMLGWFTNPHEPETKVLNSACISLANFSDAIGTEEITDARDVAITSLKDAEATILMGYTNGVTKARFDRLYLINEQLNKIFLELIEISFYTGKKMPQEISEMIKQLSSGIKLKKGEIQEVNLNTIDKEWNKEYSKLLDIIYETEDIMNTPLSNIKAQNKPIKPSLRRKIMRSFDKDSVVFINALRYGITLSIASLISLVIPFTRPYWIPLSCASVMFGATIMSTFHRAVQRSLGTIIGIVLASIILSLQPKGIMIAILTMVFVGTAELLVVKNYALVAMVITPNALLIAETSTNIHNVAYFATGRIIDIIVGALIALLGIYIMGRKSASSRLEGLIAKLLRSQCQVLVRLCSNKYQKENDTMWIREKMEINLSNLKLAYITALGEIPNNKKRLEMMWPAISILDHISYLFGQDCVKSGHLNLSDDELSQMLLIFETTATAVEQRRPINVREVHCINEIPKVCEEMTKLQNILSKKEIFA